MQKIGQNGPYICSFFGGWALKAERPLMDGLTVPKCSNKNPSFTLTMPIHACIDEVGAWNSIEKMLFKKEIAGLFYCN